MVRSRSDDAFSIDGYRPDRIVTPTTDIEVAAQLSRCRAEEASVIPVGGGTMTHLGAPPRAYDVGLSTSRLQGIVEYNPADLTAIVQAGTTMAALDLELGKHGQFLPLGVPYPDTATLGGALASNAHGPWRLAFGSARDMVIGMRMALPSGEIARSGGRVVKNVAGYDLTKLFIGSLGTLGVIVEAAVKVYPVPGYVLTLAFAAASLSDGFGIASRLQSLPPGVLMVAVLSSSLGERLHFSSPTVMATVGGTQGAVLDLAKTIGATTGTSPRILDDGEHNEAYGVLRDFPARSTLLITTRSTDVPHIGTREDEAEVLSYPHIGMTYVLDETLTVSDVVRLRAGLVPAGGHVMLRRVDPYLKRQVGVWEQPGRELELMRKIKDTFDPQQILSPGRFVGDL